MRDSAHIALDRLRYIVGWDRIRNRDPRIIAFAASPALWMQSWGRAKRPSHCYLCSEPFGHCAQDCPQRILRELINARS